MTKFPLKFMDVDHVSIWFPIIKSHLICRRRNKLLHTLLLLLLSKLRTFFLCPICLCLSYWNSILALQILRGYVEQSFSECNIPPLSLLGIITSSLDPLVKFMWTICLKFKLKFLSKRWITEKSLFLLGTLLHLCL